MNFYKFINSKDVREYLERIGHDLTALQAAWAVYDCKTASLTEKHKAYRYIIDTMPDCPVKDKFGGMEIGLHELLETMIRAENDKLRAMYDNTEAVYVLAVRHSGDEYWDENYDRVYKSYDSCIAEARDILCHRDSEGMRFMIRKLGIEDPVLTLTAWLNDELEIRMVLPQ